jgi:formylglycine-generating enzyme required for sulfatase activity
MVAIPSPEGGAGFFVDSTEVTMAQYSLFLAAKGSDTSGQPGVCAWNSSYAPTSGVDNTNVPVTSVDWCDAYAYCAWAGKHLCGQIQGGGGPIARADLFDQTKSQWFLACGGIYGNSHPSVADVCNSNFGTANLAPVATYPGCEGYYAGLFDLEGNAAEWVDSCDSQGADGGAGDICHLTGGSIIDQSSYCDEAFDYPRNETAYPFGFRCCGG